MKKFGNFGKIAQVLLAFVFVIVLAVVLGAIGGFGVVAANVGTVIAGEALSTENMETAEPGLLLDDIDEVVTKMWPAYAPLDQLLRTGIKDARRATDSIKCRHYSVEAKPINDTVTAAITAANQQALDIPVGNVSLYGIGDTIFIPSVGGYAEGAGTTKLANSALQFYIYGVDASNNLVKAIPVNGDNATTAKKSLLKTPSLLVKTPCFVPP